MPRVGYLQQGLAGRKKQERELGQESLRERKWKTGLPSIRGRRKAPHTSVTHSRATHMSVTHTRATHTNVIYTRTTHTLVLQAQEQHTQVLHTQEPQEQHTLVLYTQEQHSLVLQTQEHTRVLQGQKLSYLTLLLFHQGSREKHWERLLLEVSSWMEKETHLSDSCLVWWHTL